jgi:micrococcal nuclease
MSERARILTCVIAGLVLTICLSGAAQERPQAAPQAQTPPPALKPQARPHGVRVRVDPATIAVDDGDTAVIRWPNADVETVRILGIDTPETRHLEHDIPFDQPFGAEARAFAQGAFAAASDVELLRAAMLDPYERTLGYLFLNGRNYSLLAIKARYTTETVSFYGDNGLPKEAAEMTAAARAAGPMPFEPPHQFRTRMRALASWLKQIGQYPTH